MTVAKRTRKKQEIEDLVEEEEDVFEVAELEELDVGEPEEDSVPRMESKEWTPYVLSLLESDEVVVKDNKTYPRVVGLRRVADTLLGPIVKSGPKTLFPASGPTNLATVVYEISILWTYGAFGTGFKGFINEQDLATAGAIRTFSEVADSSIENTSYPYSKYTAATASTRAEGRALRKALQLNVVTAEEIDSENKEEPPTQSEQDDVKEISEIQKIAIKKQCENLGLNLEKTLEFHNFPALELMNRGQARDFMQKYLAKYQSTMKESLDIPANIRK